MDAKQAMRIYELAQKMADGQWPVEQVVEMHNRAGVAALISIAASLEYLCREASLCTQHIDRQSFKKSD